MSGNRRIAVLGLYNSGSTAIAGMLHRMGVYLGRQFWENSDDNSPDNHYEALYLAEHLRRWWDEPKIIEKTPAADRIRFLNTWIMQRESERAGPVGAKHPLLSMCVPDLAEAWGESTCFLWCWRPLDESIAGLLRRNWWSKENMLSAQQRLWDTLHRLEGSKHRLFRLEWNQVKTDPDWGARELARLAGLEPSEEQFRTARAFVRTSPT